jgi:hypothetical protein
MTLVSLSVLPLKVLDLFTELMAGLSNVKMPVSMPLPRLSRGLSEKGSSTESLWKTITSRFTPRPGGISATIDESDVHCTLDIPIFVSPI